MTASEIIEEIKRLDPKEQLGVIRFAYRLDAERQLTGQELSSLAERMVRTTDPAERMKVREEIVRGFYGQRRHATIRIISVRKATATEIDTYEKLAG